MQILENKPASPTSAGIPVTCAIWTEQSIITGPKAPKNKKHTKLRKLKVRNKTGWIGLEILPLEPLHEQHIEGKTEKPGIVGKKLNLPTPSYAGVCHEKHAQLGEPVRGKELLCH